MDPLSAIGIATAVAQFLDVGVKIGKRLAEYNKASPNEVPRSLQSINTQLPLLLNALQRVKSDVEVNRFDLDTRCILKGVISGCISLVEEVAIILNKVAKEPGESLTSKLRKSLASFKHDEKILAIDKNLQTYISVLILHHVIDAEDVPHGPPEEKTYYEVKEWRANPFYERSSLLRKLDQLFYKAARSQTKEPTVVVLSGTKGVGKTQLAVDYCGQSYDHGQYKTVFWLDAHTPESLMLSLESTAAVIHQSTEGTRTEKIEAVKDFLTNRWHPWLLVLDGYNHAAFDGSSVTDDLPSTGYGAILITTSCEKANTLGNVVQVSKFLSGEQKRQLSNKLLGAIQNKNPEEVEHCISQGAVINELDSNDWPHICRAAVYGNTKVFEIMMAHGADPDFGRLYGKANPLHWACYSGYSDIVKMVLDYEDLHKALQTPDDYQSATRSALEHGHAAVLPLLLDRRQVDLTKRKDDRSMLQLAVRGKSEKLVELLLDHGGVPENDTEKGNLLYMAADQGNVNILKLLVGKGKINPNLRGEYGKGALVPAVALRTDWSRKEDPRGTEMTKYLLRAGADPNFREGENPLHEAASNGFESKVKLLLEYGGDLTQESSGGWNALCYCAQYDDRHKHLYPFLLEADIPDPAARTKYLNKALQFAARKGNRELALATLSAKGVIDINNTDSKGKTPLLLAIEAGHIETARLLIRKKPRQDIPDQDGRLPLLVAAEKGYDLTVRDLLRVSKMPNVKSKDGDTALCLAAAKGHEKVVKVLLDCGADPEETNKFGDLPLDLAEEKGYKKVVKMLEEMQLEKV
ncbi:hypothetical protein MMC10_003687 [Thelotrema lepadinum]|nr:hypothetical protein [Thelotrema lepadinum]